MALLFLRGLQGPSPAAVLAAPDAGLQVVDQAVQREVPTGRCPASGGGYKGRRLRPDVHLSARDEDAHNVLVHLQQVTEQ